MPNARARRRGQSPAAAQRCAEGAGLDGGDALRSTIRRAVTRNPSRRIAEFHPAVAPQAISATQRIYTSLTGTTVWDTYEAILDACQHAWNKLMKAPERITSLTTRIWAKPVTG